MMSIIFGQEVLNLVVCSKGAECPLLLVRDLHAVGAWGYRGWRTLLYN